MAVEIPVYVDIQGAFDRAIREIPKELTKLEKVISDSKFGGLKFEVDVDGQMMSIRRLLTDSTLDAKQLEKALQSVRKAFDDAVAKGAKSTRTSGTVNNLAKAYGLLEQRIKGFYNSNAVAAMRLEDPIAKVTFKIKEMQNQLASLAPGSDKFNKINYELQIQKKRFAELTAQQMKYKAGIDASNDSFQKQAAIVKQLTGYFSGLYAVHSLIRFVKQVRDVTGELEYQRVALGHLLQDEAFGDELFAKTIEAAKESPFRIGQLVTYTKQLAAYRIEQENLFDTTQRLADISAGLGVDMNRLILAFGQVRAASVLRGQELRQFTESGIPLVELLAEKFRKLGREGTTTADVFKLISERAVPFEYIKEIFEELTDAGGQFYKMQETQAKTLQGRWEKLKDAYDQALMRVGETDTFQSMNDTVLSILNGLAKNLERVVRLVNSASIAWIAYWATTKSGLSYGARLTAMFVKEYGAVTTLKFGIAGLTASFKKLFAVLKANWVGLAIAAVSGIVTWFTTFKSKAKEAEESLSDMQKAIESMKVSNERLNFEKGLISQFESISSVTDKTAIQSEQLASAIEELKRAYPELADRIGDANTPLSEQVELLKEAAENTHNLAVEEAKSRLDTQKQLIRGLEDERDAAKQAKEIAEMRKKEAEAAEKRGPVMGITDMGEYYVEKSAKELKEETIAAAKAAKAADDAYEDVATRLANARKEAEELRKLAFPEEAKKDMSEWQRVLADARKYTSEGLTKELFTEPDIKAWDSLGDAIKKLKPQFKEAKETYEGLVSAVKEGGKLVRPELIKERDSAKDAFDAWSLLNTLLGGLLTAKEAGGGSHQTDPFVTRMQERIKFMQDFKKGYDDLSKYMAKAGALEKEGGIMLGRGMSLGLSAEDQRRAAEDLSNWYAEMIEVVSGKLKAKGVSGTSVTDLLGIDTTKRGKDIQDLQKLLQSLWDAKTDFDTSQMKKSIEDALKKLSDEIKRSETARNFYQDILGLTGDEQLAASMSVSVYGGIGDEFKDRMQQQLNGALNSLKVDKNFRVTDDIQKAFDDLDFQKILAIKDLPENVEKVVREAYEASQKYDADLLKNFASLISKYGDTAQKVATIRAKAENEINKVKDALKLSLQNTKLTPEERKALQERADEIVKALEGQRDLDEFKAGEDYVKFFSEINIMTAEQAAVVRGKLRDAYLKAFHDGAISADELRRNLRAVDEQFKKLSESTTLLGSYLSGGFDAANAKLQEYADNVGVLAEKMKSGKDLDQAEQAFATRMLKMFGGDEVKNVKSYEDLIKAFSSSGGLKEAGSAFGQMGKGMSAMAAKGPGALAIVDAIFQAVHSTITSIQQMIDELNRMRSEENKVGEWFKYVSDFDKYTYSGWEKLKSGDVIGATADAVSSWVSIFNNIQEDKVKKINEDIKDQGKLLDDLQYSYERLGNAIEKSFGSEYIYNFQKQLENLQAQAEAYRKQAELERGKGKSAEEDVAKDYEKQARDIEDQIADMRSQLSEFFAGTDLTSAAEDFANAWIEAYKEFGSTTDAMSEKFNDMIQNMITRSLAAKIMQEMLQPIFDQIDTMASDGLLATEEIAAIAALAQERIPLINDAMTNLMTSLASAGLDVRASTAGFHGISKDIAGASEESILGLAAAINTQNFYISYVPTISENVSQILAAMTGGVSPTAPVETTETGEVLPSVQRMVYDHLPNMDANIAEMLRLFRSVITTKTGSTNTNYVAIK